MPAARASRDHSKKSTFRERIRLREKCLQAKFCGPRTTSACAQSAYPSGEGRLFAEDVIVNIEGAAGTMIVSV